MLSPIYVIEVKDGSLLPQIPPGSLIRVQQDTWDELEEGDVAVLSRGGQHHLGRVCFQGGEMRLEALHSSEESFVLDGKDRRRLERVIGVDFH